MVLAFQIRIQVSESRPVSLAVRTPASHAGIRGSIPLRGTNKAEAISPRPFLFKKQMSTFDMVQSTSRGMEIVRNERKNAIGGESMRVSVCHGIGLYALVTYRGQNTRKMAASAGYCSVDDGSEWLEGCWASAQACVAPIGRGNLWNYFACRASTDRKAQDICTIPQK